MFGAEFERDEVEIHSLLIQARERRPGQRGTGAVARALKAARRRVLTSPWGMAPSRYPRAIRGIAILAVVAVLGGGATAIVRARLNGAYATALRLADERMQLGRWIGPGGDTALNHLLEARALKPDEAPAREQLERLADRFELLGDAALSRNDDAEAAVHFQAAVSADALRGSAAAQLKTAEERVRQRSLSNNRKRP